MKVPYAWLKEWVDIPWDPQALGTHLTMAGLELEALEPGDTLVLNVTPNRGDAMSIVGIAREVAALAGTVLRGPPATPVEPRNDARFPVKISAPEGCPKFVSRVIRGVNNRAASPAWLRERLNAAGVRSIGPVVDVTNYVMLELGTPMHSYDLAKLERGIEVRFAAPDEKLRLLDGQDVQLDAGALLIADAAGAVGIAGVMGGERTSIVESTRDVFLELAFFTPTVISRSARRYGLITDAAQRFERGVDPQAQERAIERATQLLIEIAGGEPGPRVDTVVAERLPQRAPVHLRRERLARLTGIEIDDLRVAEILSGLGMQVKIEGQGWRVIPPSHRFDITIEADLIEEVARVFGYAAVPERRAREEQIFIPTPESRIGLERVAVLLADRGYQEAITYSFVDPVLQETLFPGVAQLALRNSIAADMSVMRVSLWPGLLSAARENLRRQQPRVRMFESGRKFAGLREVQVVSGLAVGLALPEQWGEKKRTLDFFDVKGDVEALLEMTGCAAEFKFLAQAQSCLHPGRSARIIRGDTPVGWLGELHPDLIKSLDLNIAPLLFELETETALSSKIPIFKEISKFPSIRRDLALVVDANVPLDAIREHVTVSAAELLHAVQVFDLYHGPGVETGRKSIALGLILQETSRTLTDQDADRIVTLVIDRLRRELNASIRA